MSEQSYIQIGSDKFPVQFDPSVATPVTIDGSYLSTWLSDWRKDSEPISFTMRADLTECGKALAQQYGDATRYDLYVNMPDSGYGEPLTIYSSHTGADWSSQRRRPRNTRVIAVQAKRKRLYLSQDGKCTTLRTRKASLALRLAEERWYKDMSTKQPVPDDFEHTPLRRRKRREKRFRSFARELRSMCDVEFTDFMDRTEDMFRNYWASLRLSPQEIGDLSNVNRTNH
jgi:hypothetical protein